MKPNRIAAADYNISIATVFGTDVGRRICVLKRHVCIEFVPHRSTERYITLYYQQRYIRISFFFVSNSIPTM